MPDQITMGSTIMPFAFNEYWAVVLHNRYGGRMLWSAALRAWLAPRDFSVGFGTYPYEPGQAEPWQDEIQEVLAINDRLDSDRICQHCGLTDRADHLIVPNASGVPTRYCLQRPPRDVVYSRGGGGNRKHWGTMFGCAAVEAAFSTDSWGSELATYGQGVVASHLRDLDWCGRCTGLAGNIARAAQERSQTLRDYVEERENELLQRREQNRTRRR